MIEHWYLACMILMTSPFYWHHVVTLTLTFDLLQGQICCQAPFLLIPCGDLDLWPTSRSNLLPGGGPQFFEFACVFWMVYSQRKVSIFLLYYNIHILTKLSWFLVHLSQRLKCTIVITRCPSSVVRPSVCLSVCPSVVNFSNFQFLLWNCWTEFDETWQEARSQHPLPSLCFSGRSEKQDGRPGLWLAETFLTSPIKPLNGIQRNLTGSKIWTSSTKFVFFGPIGKTRWPPWPLRMQYTVSYKIQGVFSQIKNSVIGIPAIYLL